MPSDLITRLFLNNQQFDSRLKESKGQVETFKNGVSSAGASLLKFAGMFGAAVTAGEAFNKTINSTQATGDAFAKVMDQGKASVNAFFTSIAMGDISGFIDNLQTIIDKAGSLSEILDELGTKTLFSNSELNTLMFQKKIQENMARDRTRSDIERNRALKEAREIQMQINSLQRDLAKQNETSSLATVKSAITQQGFKGDFSAKDWDFFQKESNRKQYTGLSEKYKEFMASIEAAKKLQTVVSGGGLFTQVSSTKVDTEKSRQLKSDFLAWKKTEEGRLASMSYYFVQLADDEQSMLAQALSLKDKSENMYASISDAELGLANVDAKINGSATSKGVETNKADVQLNLVQGKTNDEIKSDIYKIAQSYDGISFPVHLQPQFIESEETSDMSGSIVDYQQRIQDVTLAYNEATTDGLRSLYAKQREDLESHLQDMTDTNQGMIDISNELNSLIQSGVVSGFESLGEAIASDDAGEAMRGMLMSMMDMLKQFGAALVAAGMAKLAFDKLLTQPWAAIAAGGALIVATSVAKSSLQKSISAGNYAEGGIAPYRFTVGDRMTVGIDGGEMILTTGQQAKLFDLLDLGRTSTSNSDRVLSGRLVAEGSQLVAVIESTAKKQRRGR